jgi:hypothetical protein
MRGFLSFDGGYMRYFIAVIIICCGCSNPKVTQNNAREIRDRVSLADINGCAVPYEYNGHKYIKFNFHGEHGQSAIHDPDCLLKDLARRGEKK